MVVTPYLVLKLNLQLLRGKNCSEQLFKVLRDCFLKLFLTPMQFSKQVAEDVLY